MHRVVWTSARQQAFGSLIVFLLLGAQPTELGTGQAHRVACNQLLKHARLEACWLLCVRAGVEWLSLGVASTDICADEPAVGLAGC